MRYFRFSTKLLVLAVLAAVSGGTACADELVSGLSQDQIAITSNFTGTDLVVFGAVQNALHNSVTAEPDIVVVLRGPNVEMTVRQKERILGMWINRHEDRLYGMPGYYYLASSKPLDKIAPADVLTRYQIGLNSIRPSDASAKGAKETGVYTRAAIRRESELRLYAQNDNGVEFLSPQLFRVRVPIPAAVPQGQYTAEVYLFENGAIVSAQSTPLFVDQAGLERRLFAFAHSSPALYGLTAVSMALSLGWASAMIFRRR